MMICKEHGFTAGIEASPDVAQALLQGTPVPRLVICDIDLELEDPGDNIRYYLSESVAHKYGVQDGQVFTPDDYPKMERSVDLRLLCFECVRHRFEEEGIPFPPFAQ